MGMSVAINMHSLLNYAPCHEDVLGSGGTAPYINLSNRWMWVGQMNLATVKFIPL